MDIEEGLETYITRDLRISLLPESFHYYDPIMVTLHQRISDDRKEFFIKKNQIFDSFRKNSIKSKLLDIFEDKKKENEIDSNKFIQLEL